MSTITGITFDQPEYMAGQPVTMTVTGQWEQADVVSVVTPDGASGQGQLEVVQPVSASDTGSHTWVLKSNNGTQAVFTTTA